MQDHKPLFSILICTVGKEELTRGAIRSILNQTHHDFEIIVTDTSGTDYIRHMTESFKDTRIKYFDVPNQDPTIGWEFAYEQSTGQYILWYDDDNRLVPWALGRYAELISRYKADIVSGNHVYYFGPGNRHNPQADNSLTALLPFSCQEKVYRPDAILRAIYDLSIGRPVMPARWHSAATFVSRTVCEAAEQKLGYIIAPHLLGNFTFHPVIAAFAHTPVYDDHPLCIIGKFANSITQQWSNSSQIKRSTARPYRFTGVSERTLGNTTVECYLQVRHDFPEHETYPLNWEKFYRRYSGELLLLNIPFVRHMRAWRELWLASTRVDEPSRQRLRRVILKQWIQSVAIQVLRFLRIWDMVRTNLKKTVAPSERRKSVPLEKYGVHSIEECVPQLAQIMRQEWGVSIKPRSSV
jgi:glycosyltransferase involved in cell wall biosynthesis